MVVGDDYRVCSDVCSDEPQTDEKWVKIEEKSCPLSAHF